MFKSFEELMEAVNSLELSSKEKEDIQNDAEIIATNSWEKYIMLSANILEEIKQAEYLGVHLWGGLASSSLLQIGTEQDINSQNALMVEKGEKTHSYMFRDGKISKDEKSLKLEIHIHNVEPKLSQYVKKTSEIIERNLLNSNLIYREAMIYQEEGHKREVIIISENKLSQSEYVTISRLCKRDEELPEELASKCFLLFFSMSHGI